MQLQQEQTVMQIVASNPGAARVFEISELRHRTRRELRACPRRTNQALRVLSVAFQQIIACDMRFGGRPSILY